MGHSGQQDRLISPACVRAIRRFTDEHAARHVSRTPWARSLTAFFFGWYGLAA